VFRVADDPRDVSYYLELKTTLLAGLFVAARHNAVHFRELARASGVADRWDYDVRRLQLGSGYRLGVVVCLLTVPTAPFASTLCPRSRRASVAVSELSAGCRRRPRTSSASARRS
jgi:hypothetical protein